MSVSKKLGAYSVAAGAAAMGVAGVAKAELQIYDHRTAPLTPEVEYWDPGTPDDLVVLRMDGSAKYKLTAGGGGAYNYYDENHDLTTPIDGTDKSGDAVWFMYEWYPHPDGGKDGVVFHTEPTNGVAGFADGVANRPYLLAENDVVDVSLDYYTDGTGVSIFGHGAGGSGWFDGYGYGEHYLGFFMEELDGRHYGWVHINQPWYRISTSILGWAYQDEADAAALVNYGPAPAPPGDFDGIDGVNDVDIDMLCDFIRNSLPYDLLYDISGAVEGVADGFVDTLDLDYLIRSLVETSLGTGTEYGDFNLDGVIDTTDLTRLATNYGADDWGWDDGNANRYIDTDIDNTDLTILATYYGFGEPDVVPEPATLSLLAVGAAGLLRRRRRA